MQNKANFLDDEMNVTSFITINYEQRTMNYEIKNKPKTNPIQTQYKANTNPIRTQFKPKQTQFQRQYMLNLTITPRLKPFDYHATKPGLQYIFRKFWRFVRKKLSKCVCLMYLSQFFALFTLNRLIDFLAMDRCVLRRRYTKTNFTASNLNNVYLDVIANHNRFILMSAEYQHF